MSFNRRNILNAMGIGAGSLFLPSLIGDKKALAAPPKRIYFFHTQHGPNYWDWNIRQPGLDDKNSDWEIDLKTLPESSWSRMLKPLYAHRDDLLVLDGLADTAAMASVTTNNHNRGNSCILTNASLSLNGGYNMEGTGGDISVDQVIAKEVAVSGR